MSKYSLDEDNQRMYGARAKEWSNKAEDFKKAVESFEKSDKKAVETVEKSGGSGIIKETERALSFRDMNNAMEYAADKLSLSADDISALSMERVTAILSSVRDLYREIPTLNGFIDDIVLTDMNEIAKATLRWSEGKPRVLLKLSKGIFKDMSLSEINTFIDDCVDSNTFSSKSGLYGVFKHEFGHFGEYKHTLKRYNYSEDDVRESLGKYEFAKEIKELALKKCNLINSDEVVRSYLSDYACQNPAEFIAEAYSCTDSNNVLANEVKRLLRRKWGI